MLCKVGSCDPHVGLRLARTKQRILRRVRERVRCSGLHCEGLYAEPKEQLKQFVRDGGSVFLSQRVTPTNQLDIGKPFAAVEKAIKSAANSAVGSLKNVGEKIAEGVVDNPVFDAIETVGDKVEDVAEDAVGAVENAVSSAVDAIGDVAGDIESGLLDAAEPSL